MPIFFGVQKNGGGLIEVYKSLNGHDITDLGCSDKQESPNVGQSYKTRGSHLKPGCLQTSSFRKGWISGFLSPGGL